MEADALFSLTLSLAWTTSLFGSLCPQVLLLTFCQPSSLPDLSYRHSNLIMPFPFSAPNGGMSCWCPPGKFRLLGKAYEALWLIGPG